MKQDRRDFLKLTGTAALSGLAASSVRAKEDGIRYNVLFFSSDQHNPHFMSCDAQAPLNVYTPNMARLAREGTIFDKTYATVPVCAPTRASLVTGEFPQTHRQFGNSAYLCEAGPDGAAPSIAHLFRAAGYNTALIGKTHSNMQGWDAYPAKRFEGKELFLGFDYRLERCCASHHAKSPDMVPSETAFKTKKKSFRKRFPEKGMGEGQPKWEKSIYEQANQHDPKKRFVSRALSHAADNSDGIYTYEALDYLQDYARGGGKAFKLKTDQPFFLFVSVVQPHWAWVSPQMQDGIDFYGMYSGRAEDDKATYQHADEKRNKIALKPVTPDLRANDMDGWPSPYKSAGARPQKPEAIRLARARYASATSWVDHLLGMVLKELDTLPDPNNPGKKLSETTIVCYTSDHGDMMGEKSRFNKMVMFEGSARIPFIVRGPGLVKAGQRSNLLLNHADMFPTLAGLCGLGGKLRSGMAGRNLAEAVKGNDATLGPKRTFSVNLIRKSNEQPGVIMSRTQRYKFLRFGREPRDDGRPYVALFDMDKDPFETKNLAEDPEYRKVVAEENEACNRFLARWNVPLMK